MRTLGFIGTGNMGGALARAASRQEDNRLLLFNRHPEKAEALRAQIGGTVTDQKGAVDGADYLFLGVKPIMLPTLAETLRPQLKDRQSRVILVSMIAGIEIAKLQEILGGSYPVIRIMPNTPVSVGEGMILYCCSAEVTPDEEKGFLSAMTASGRFLRLEERLIDAGMGVSGCGPAFVDLFVEALSDAAVACGMPRADAITLAAQMTMGSAKLILESGKHPAELKDAVCSPGGTTIQGVRKLEEKGFRSAVFEAVLATCGKL
ncbi:MAG: pyrroline-5-carboxylate reductase [Oscillospiraceae bacterium]|nr:pyrroline-5-carboxylate reductase [Oscillospiraceae bacterium]